MASSSTPPPGRTTRPLIALTTALFCLVLPQIALPTASAQGPVKAEKLQSNLDALEQHYQAARTFAIAGDMGRAATEYRQFLSDIFREMGNARTHEGNFPAAFPLFDEAVRLDPNSADSRLAYGTALLLSGENDKA